MGRDETIGDRTRRPATRGFRSESEYQVSTRSRFSLEGMPVCSSDRAVPTDTRLGFRSDSSSRERRASSNGRNTARCLYLEITE